MSRRTTRRLAAVVGLGVLVLLAPGARAQNLGLVVRDGSVGPDLAPGDSGIVPAGGGASYLITPDLGEQSGANLFHSFRLFSIGDSEIARFIGAPTIDNIISRVNGGQRSDILGRLESPDANLFLLNPYGVFFGEDSSVDVNGSFYVSTADELRFDAGDPFVARATSDPVSLNSAPPVAFGFLIDDPAGVEFDGARLCAPQCVPDGGTFSVVAGDVVIRGRGDRNPALNVPGGDLQFVAVEASGVEVPLDASGLDVRAFAPGSFAEVRTEANAVLQVNGESGGSTGSGRIVIRGGKFVMEAGEISAVARNALDGAPKAVDVAVSDSIELGASGGRRAFIQSTSSGDGASGDIHLAAASVSLTDGARVVTQTSGSADGADIFVDADTVNLVGQGAGSSQQTQLFVRNQNATAGSSGSIWISGRAPGPDDRADGIHLTSGAQVITTGNRDGVSGTLAFRAQTFGLEDGSEIFSLSQQDSPGAAIRVDAGNAFVTGGSNISSEVQGSATGARIEITADVLELTDDGSITSLATGAASGDGGGIQVTAPNVTVTGGGRIASENLGLGTGGGIDVTAPVQLLVADEGQITTATRSLDTGGARRGGDLTIDAGLVTVQAGEGAVDVAQISAITSAAGAPDSGGMGGALELAADSVQLLDGGQLRTTTDGSAAAGALSVTARNNLLIRGAVNGGGLPSGIFATSGRDAGSTATGDGGSLTVSARVAELENGGEIGTSTFGPGTAGDLTVNALERLSIRGDPTGERSVIAAQGDVGGGGNLSITTDVLELIDGGEVSVSALDTGDSGNVDITARTVLVKGANPETPSGVFAQTASGRSDAGNAGSITLKVAESLRVTDGGQVAVTTRGGGFAGDLVFEGGGSVEISNGGFVSARAEGPITDAAPENASDIRIVDASQVTVTTDGTLTAETTGSGFGGSIDIQAANIDVSAGGRITAQSLSTGSDAGAAGSISLRASEALQVSGATITTEANQAAGGDITLAGGRSVAVDDGSEISARANGDGAAGGILVRDTDSFTLANGSTMTAETTARGAGGQIAFRDVGSVLLTSGSRVTTRSTGVDGGSAGPIVIAALDRFQADQGSEVTTTAFDAGGGRISIQAGDLVYLLDSRVETTVQGAKAIPGEDAGDIDITLRGDEIDGLDPVVPKFVVINRSLVKANANATDAGNITIAGNDVLISSDSLIEATSQTGVSGQIQISSPDADVVGQVTPLPSEFVDPSDRLLPPCIARTERTGSFVVRSRAAIPPSPDAPLSPSTGGAFPQIDSVSCPEFEENP